MNLKKISAALLFMVFGTITVLNAQIFNSGDKELDGSLLEINAQAKLDLSSFKIGLKAEFSLTTEKATVMLKTMEPADLYMVVLVSSICGKPVETVSASYLKNKGKGWGVIAKEMGIKPGSKQFHQLKEKTKAKHSKMKGNGKPKAKPNPKVKGTQEIKSTPSKAGAKGKTVEEKPTTAKGKSK